MWQEPVPGSDSLAPELVLVSMHHPFGAFGGIFRFQIPEPPTGSEIQTAFGSHWHHTIGAFGGIFVGTTFWFGSAPKFLTVY